MKNKVTGDRNQCPGCEEMFNSSAAFDRHRTGDFGIDRRCLTVEEMLVKKMVISPKGYWVTSLNSNWYSDASTDTPDDDSSE